ncbi:MAG: hypothetical protein SPE49_03970 [Campylobacter sp.]|uniref:hypothetical protein n=1 Tax=Campylobacter sp. TaxID=205 RepID=UPI002A81DBAB|nr:hypothetical protein [Campylobacter sp.]MCI7587161.1 hypothetical protein [Campylobacter sp.]MDY5115112.1 hypothetical protein [Campylobacter sp.]
MKKLALSVVVAGVFLAGCGGNLPKEITSHENYKNCQEVEKNLLTIQSSFEKDERVEFYSNCTRYFKERNYDDLLNKSAIDDFKNNRTEHLIQKGKLSLNELHKTFVAYSFSKAQENNRDNTKYFSK